ncbi:STAS domain-containing protein [Kitasatospora sp. NPDC086791]|uniref:STAS domain-containing protein n=1 Tax=Kitasatospora sp. NPDC086791 TaxID=3155178 RepID=UPI003426D673
MHTLHTAAALVTARGDLDLCTAPELRRRLSAALRAYREVVLDLAGVEFMDCSGLGALVHAQNQADRLGARLILRGAGPRVLRLLKLTGLNRRLIVEA